MPSKTRLAQSHLQKLDIPDRGGEDAGRSITLRYDGFVRNDSPVIFAVIGTSDLAKLPASAMRGLNMLSQGPDGSLRGSQDAFFREGAQGVSLYVDSDVHEDFVDRLVGAAKAEGLSVFSARGDIELLIGPGGDVDPPAVPAFVQNGARPVPVRQAVEMIHTARRDLEKAREMSDHEDTALYPQP